jgi:hypothetical protein
MPVFSWSSVVSFTSVIDYEASLQASYFSGQACRLDRLQDFVETLVSCRRFNGRISSTVCQDVCFVKRQINFGLIEFADRSLASRTPSSFVVYFAPVAVVFMDGIEDFDDLSEHPTAAQSHPV